MGRVAVLEVRDLAVEVFFLVGGADSGVDDFFLLRTLLVVLVAEELKNVVLEVEAFASGHALTCDFPIVRPSPEAGVGDVIVLSDVLGGHVHVETCFLCRLFLFCRKDGKCQKRHYDFHTD